MGLGRRSGLSLIISAIIEIQPPCFFSPKILTNLQKSLIVYRTTDISEIDLIYPLWIKLNDYMLGKAGTFRTHYEQMTFEERKAYFNKVAAAGTLHLDLAVNLPVREK